MNYKLAYGKKGLEFGLQDDLDVQVLEPVNLPGLADVARELADALQSPLASRPLQDLVHSGDRVGIVVNDVTRPTPTPLLLDAVRESLSKIPDEDIQIFIATGTHRANTPLELEDMLGKRWHKRFRIYQNDAHDADAHIEVGTTSSGNRVLLHKELLACDLRIATGFIEPHLFAGYSGGGKAFLPGMAGIETILGNHSPSLIDHPNAAWGVLAGNPIQNEINEAAVFCEPSFLVNITLNQQRQVTRVFAGDMKVAHEAGCKFVKENSMVPVEGAFDIVITSNAGYPLDLNVYQSVKGMSAAALITKPGGAIVIAAECWDGIPERGEYANLMKMAETPAGVLEVVRAPGFVCQDSWQAQIQAVISLDKEIHLYSELLDDEQIRSVKLIPSRTIESTVSMLLNRFGRAARICVLPEGPLTIPYISG